MTIWAAIAAFLREIWETVKPHLPTVATGVVGTELQKGWQAKSTIKKVEKANEAARDMRGKPHDERLRYLKGRGLHRVHGPREGDK